MYSKYFKYVMVLAFLVGLSAPLPQVRGQVLDVLSMSSSNTAFVFGATKQTPAVMQKMLTPQEVVYILVKEGVIPSDKIGQAHKILAQHMKNNREGEMKTPAGEKFKNWNDTSSPRFNGENGSTSVKFPPQPVRDK